jgi:hypothetical protein
MDDSEGEWDLELQDPQGRVHIQIPLIGVHYLRGFHYSQMVAFQLAARDADAILLAYVEEMVRLSGSDVNRRESF